MALAALAAAALFGVVQGQAVWPVIAWAGCVLSVDLIRLGLVVRFRRRLSTQAAPWLEPVFVATAWMSAALWVGFGLVVPPPADPATGSFTLLLPIAIAATAVISYGASAWAAVGTVVLILSGLLIAPPAAAGALGPLGPGLIVLVGFILMTGALRHAQTIRQVVALDLDRRAGMAQTQALTETLEESTLSQLEAERELSRTGSLLHTLADAAPVGLFRATVTGRLDYLNALGRQMLGLEDGEPLPDNPWYRLLHPTDQYQVEQAWIEGTAQERQARVQLRTGTWWLLVRWAPMMDDEGTMLGVAGTVTDITEAKAREESLTLQATTDGLTGLLNRTHFLALAQREVDRAVRYHRPLAVIALDLDHFKTVNDRYGHAGGDVVLKEFAVRARSILRGSDILGRTGGEEFSLCLAECGLEGAVILAERLRRSVAESVFTVDEGETQAKVTISLGIAVLHDESEGLAELLKRADTALYRAKAQGRNCLAVADPPPRSLPCAPMPHTGHQ